MYQLLILTLFLPSLVYCGSCPQFSPLDVTFNQEDVSQLTLLHFINAQSYLVFRHLVWNCQNWRAVRKRIRLCRRWLFASRPWDHRHSKPRKRHEVSRGCSGCGGVWLLIKFAIFSATRKARGTATFTDQANVLQVKFDPRAPAMPYWIVDTDLFGYSVVASCVETPRKTICK